MTMNRPKSTYQQTTDQVKLVRTLARVAGVFSPKLRENWKAVEREYENVEEIKRRMSQFAERFSPFGWALYDRMSTEVLEKIEHASQDEGEVILTKFHLSAPSCTQLKYRFMTPQFTPWLHIYERALDRCEASDWISAAPLLLICIDGLLTTTTGKHPFSGAADADVFDTVTSEPGGLSEGLRVLGATRRKLSMEPIDAPFRHGIVHGLNPQYGSPIVVAKAINLLQATVDYVQNLSDQTQRLEKARKAQEPPSWAALRTQWLKNNAARAALEAWEPRDEVLGPIATNLENSGVDADSPEHAAIVYLAQLAQANYGAVAAATVDYVQRPVGHRAGLLRKDLQGLTVKEWAIATSKDITAAMTHLDVEMTVLIKGTSSIVKSQLRMMYSDESLEAMARGVPEGKWRAMANLTTDLWVHRQARA